MKMISRVLMTAVAVAALAAPAVAADKLIVQDATGTKTVFVVSDTAKVGVATATPTTALHVASEDGLNALRGFTNSQHSTGVQGAVINFVKSRGTQAAPTTLVSGDYIGAFVAQFWNGTAYDRGAQFNFRTEGTVTGTSTPTAIVFQTGDAAVNLKEVLRMTSIQNVIVGNLGGVATTDMATTATNGFLYIPNVAGALTTCASVTVHAGHVPVWFDTTNSKICTCQGVTLKCTAALL